MSRMTSSALEIMLALAKSRNFPTSAFRKWSVNCKSKRTQHYPMTSRFVPMDIAKEKW